MPTATSRLLAVAGAWAVLICNAAVLAAPPEAIPPVAPVQVAALARAPAEQYVGNLSCNSVNCHGRDQRVRYAGRAYQQAGVVWQRHDPHARAAATLTSEAFQKILKRAGDRGRNPPDAHVYLRCAKCHDPAGIAAAQESGAAEVTAPAAEESLASRGIACESCHGGAEKWLGRHFQRSVSRSELVSEHGLVDTKNLAVRGKVCAACHIGDGDKDMNHDLIAAGHPPLRFELASYHGQIRSKHWDDARERIATVDFEAKLWAAGQLASADSALRLLEARMGGGSHPASETAWPEFAEYNCFSCHQRLKVVEPKEQTARFAGSAGWNTWDHALAGKLVAGKELETLAVAMQKNFDDSQRDQVRAAIAAYRHKLSRYPGDSLAGNSASLAEKLSSPAEMLEFLSRPASSPPSWEECCQRYLGLVALERSFRDEARKHGQPIPALHGNWEIIRHDLSFVAPSAQNNSVAPLEWPRAFSLERVSNDDKLAEITTKLNQAAMQLQQARRRTP